MPLTTRTSIVTLALFAAATVACGRSDETQAPPAQSTTQTTQPLNRPTTVTGCLRGGDAENTYVLTTTQSENGVNPATYQLAGTAGVNLQDHVGKRIEVSGTLTEQQHVATTDSPTTVDDKARGTSGTPTVQTSTQVAVRRLAVTGVKAAGGECEQQQ
jgi:hypothetical protein